MKEMAKITLVCSVALGTFSSAAHAQSSVMLYGLLDEAVMYLNNVGGGKKVFLDATSAGSSRWGMSGSEDLGGGLRAIFTLESGVNLNNGTFAQGGTAFGRQAFVGLSSDRFGSATFGRQYDMVLYFAQNVTTAGPITPSAVFAHPGDIDNTANSVRINNSIRYMSPNYRGFSFGGVYSVGGVAGNVTANSGYSVGAGYVNGPFKIGAAFQYFKNPSSTTAGSGFFTNNANGGSLLVGSLNKGYASASAYQAAVVGAGYTIGPLSFVTSFSNVQYANLGGTLLGGTARFNNADIGAKYAFSPSLFLSVGYNYQVGKGVTTTSGRTVGDQHYNQIGMIIDYYLSKRTDVYFAGVWQRASGTSSTGAPAVANIALLGDSSNNHQFVLRAALRHRF